MEKTKRFSYCKFTIEEEKLIIKQYQEGNSMAQLGKRYNCDPSTICNILKAYKVQSRNLSEARRNYLGYTINEKVFEKINTNDQSYWLGVMYSDGYINKTRDYTNYFGISVQASDKEWLENFKNFLQYNGDIKQYLTTESAYKVNVPYVRLLIGNNKIVSDLENYGVIENKSKLIQHLPDIPYLDDFIRGYIDGDGSLRKAFPNISICGNKNFLEDIGNYFQLPYKIYQDKSIYGLHYNKNESEYLEKRLYKNAHYYLERKYKIAQRSFNSPLTLEDVRIKNPEYQGKPLEH